MWYNAVVIGDDRNDQVAVGWLTQDTFLLQLALATPDSNLGH